MPFIKFPRLRQEEGFPRGKDILWKWKEERVMESSAKIAHAYRDKAVFIWNWEDAPEEFKKMSTSGGDEDYVMFVPAGIEPFYKLYDLSCCDNKVNKQLDGSEIVIGSHA